jgi:hypothetical protein
MSDLVPLMIGRSVIEGAPCKLVLVVQWAPAPVVVVALAVVNTTVRAKMESMLHFKRDIESLDGAIGDDKVDLV